MKRLVLLAVFGGLVLPATASAIEVQVQPQLVFTNTDLTVHFMAPKKLRPGRHFEAQFVSRAAGATSDSTCASSWFYGTSANPGRGKKVTMHLRRRATGFRRWCAGGGVVFIGIDHDSGRAQRYLGGACFPIYEPGREPEDESQGECG